MLRCANALHCHGFEALFILLLLVIAQLSYRSHLSFTSVYSPAGIKAKINLWVEIVCVLVTSQRFTCKEDYTVQVTVYFSLTIKL